MSTPPCFSPWLEIGITFFDFLVASVATKPFKNKKNGQRLFGKAFAHSFLFLKAGGRSGDGTRKLLVPGLPTNLDNRGARTYCACSKCRWRSF